MGVAASKLGSKQWKKTCGTEEVHFHLMNQSDEDSLRKAIGVFASSLPSSDLVFLRMDITQPEAIDEWVDNVRRGRTITVLAELNGQIIGYGNLHMSSLQWTSHIGEIRILVSGKYRKLGIGKELVKDLIDIAQEKGLARVVAHIAATQPPVRLMFESLEFDPEALLTDWLKDHNGQIHDLIIMSRLIED
jgi:L-amino acid N-acyltransferase YncA